MLIFFKIITLGCPKNEVDSEQMKGLLIREGLTYVEDVTKAQIILINTCGFINAAKQESIETVLEYAEYKNSGNCEYLLVTGCLVQKYVDELKQALPEVDMFLGTGDILELPKLLNMLQEKSTVVQVTCPENYLYDDSLKRNVDLNDGYYAYVKIAEGCNNFCTYCVIPYLRGSYRSRTIESIVEEVKGLVNNGIKEIILVAQDTTLYGVDLEKKYLLPQLLKELVKIEKLCWIRLLYCYPNHITEELLETIKNEEKICSYLDIPLQHISDSILKAMKRPMNKESTIKLLNKIRNTIPDVAIRSTFIVGFPGETNEHFEELIQFIEKVELDRAGFFAYSREPDTVAASLPNQISEEEKAKRIEIISRRQESILAAKQASLINKTLEVIIDGKSLDYEGLWEGRTKNDAPEIDSVVYFKPEPKVNFGDIIKIKITHSCDYALMGEVVNESS
ncbi:MAG: 30S ribosomal protein S12 methylthiotransferase RimO [Clostridia bacterium]|nr:30S ribosomal protein S12 methylthiotransferase RimO [Clostridia bacterium]MDD4047643.1 30S ribosomal protein S12 methylthiotransferase RimO [Clostridia bacterium]